LHSIVGDFETGIQYGAMFGALLVKDGIGVVDVDKDFAAFGVGGKLLEEPGGALEGKMADFASGFFAAAGVDEFVVGPEGAVDEDDVSGGCGFGPFGGMRGKGRGDEELLIGLFERESDGGVVRSAGVGEFVADVVGV